MGRKGVIRQSAAMPLGHGCTFEEQLTGEAEHGGVQLNVYPLSTERYRQLIAERAEDAHIDFCLDVPRLEDASMGLAPGGKMKQEIYEDPYGLDAWDQRRSHRCFISLVNSMTKWLTITAERPPYETPTARDYTNCGLPWFDYCGGDANSLEASKNLDGILSVIERGKAKGVSPLLENDLLTKQPNVLHVSRSGKKQSLKKVKRFSDEIQQAQR